jgi:hypothetical protein
MFNRIKSIFTNQKGPPPEFHDAELGLLTAESDLWSGTVTRDGFTIPFTVAGTQGAPSSGLLDRKEVKPEWRLVKAYISVPQRLSHQ